MYGQQNIKKKKNRDLKITTFYYHTLYYHLAFVRDVLFYILNTILFVQMQL